MHSDRQEEKVGGPTFQCSFFGPSSLFPVPPIVKPVAEGDKVLVIVLVSSPVGGKSQSDQIMASNIPVQITVYES